MEVQFTTTTYPFLKTITHGCQIREEVQQIKLPDSFPDIDRIVDCSGQILIRGKEWRSDGIRVSGGVMVWVLYAPGDGTELKSVEGWIPFQGKWDFRDSKQDGSVCVTAHIQNLDARSISARKLMVRCNISICAEALEPASCQIMQVDKMPEDIQFLINTYPLEVPLEAGEKLTQIEESMDLSGTRIGRILSARTEPVILESRIMANRLVFRGKVNLHVIYCGDDGNIKAFDGEIPFSQYTDLDHEYTEAASAVVQPVLTVSEVEADDLAGLSCKCSMAVQYVVYDRRNLTVAEDAYCPGRKTALQWDHISVPVRLDTVRQDLRLEDRVEGAGKLLSVQLETDCPEVMQVSDAAQIRIPGTFRLLVQDPEGNFRMQSCSVEDKWEITSASDNRLRVCTSMGELTTASTSGDETVVSSAVQAEVHVLSEQEFTFVSAIQLEEQAALDPNRPSLILCRPDGDSLWQIAKRYGSTVDALCRVNGITEEADGERLLLVPIA